MQILTPSSPAGIPTPVPLLRTDFAACQLPGHLSICSTYHQEFNNSSRGTECQKPRELPVPAQAVCQQRCDETSIDDGCQRALPSLSLSEELRSLPRTPGRTGAAVKNFQGIKTRKRWERLPLEESPSMEVSPGGKHVAGEALRAAVSLGTASGRAAPEGHGASCRYHPNRVTPIAALQEGDPHPRHAPSAPAAHGSDQAQTRLLRAQSFCSRRVIPSLPSLSPGTDTKGKAPAHAWQTMSPHRAAGTGVSPVPGVSGCGELCPAPLSPPGRGELCPARFRCHLSGTGTSALSPPSPTVPPLL